MAENHPTDHTATQQAPAQVPNAWKEPCAIDTHLQADNNNNDDEETKTLRTTTTTTNPSRPSTLDENDRPTTTDQTVSTGVVVPVGVTVAAAVQHKKQKLQGIHKQSTIPKLQPPQASTRNNKQPQQQQQSPKGSKTRRNTTQSAPSTNRSSTGDGRSAPNSPSPKRSRWFDWLAQKLFRRPKKKPVSSLQVFVAASLVYASCVWLPSGIGHILHYFLRHSQEESNAQPAFRMWMHGWLLYWHEILPEWTHAYLPSLPVSQSDDWMNNTVASVGMGDWIEECCPEWLVAVLSWTVSSTRPETNGEETVYFEWDRFLLLFWSSPQNALSHSPMPGHDASPSYHHHHHHHSSTNHHHHSLIWSPDAAWTDVGVVVGLSVLLAVWRLGLAYCLVPIQQCGEPAVQALVKLKSVHLLSRDYPLTPQISRTKTKLLVVQDMKKERSANDNDLDEEEDEIEPTSKTQTASIMKSSKKEDDDFPMLPDLGGLQLDPILRPDTNDTSLQPKLGEPTTTMMNDRLTWTRLSLHSPTPTLKKGPKRQTQQSHGATDETPDPTSFASQKNDYSAPWSAEQQQKQEQDHQRRLYAAPRMATALFRFTYSVMAVWLAWTLFHTTSFWPWYVGGQGSTKACWDLSGTLVFLEAAEQPIVQSLKRYFLWQVSYHCHAGVFYILSAAWLFLWGRQEPAAHGEPHDQRRRRRFAWNSAGIMSFSTSSLVEHFLSLSLIGTAYIFSSLRRLGAVGLFAFDVSSAFLHLLQLAMNYMPLPPSTATVTTELPPPPPPPYCDDQENENLDDHNNDKPQDMPTTNPSNPPSSPTTAVGGMQRLVCRILFYVGVVPSFVVARFLIWPALWRSAWTAESFHWFQQLEQTLFWGASWTLQCLWNACLLAVLMLNAIYFRRLVGGTHPHLKRILE